MLDLSWCSQTEFAHIMSHTSLAELVIDSGRFPTRKGLLVSDVGAV